MSEEKWTTETLKAYVERLLVEHDKRYEQRFSSQQEAVRLALASMGVATDKAEANAEKWRNAANEWRGAMSDRDRLLMPRIETEQRLMALSEKINGITKICVGAIMLGISVVTVILLILRQ